MLGLGFLFGGALLGTATIAWPIYLHIRTKRNRRIQVVPSLRLFGFARKQTRRIRLEQLLLMLARVCLLAALFAMLAQPYWETELDLPLPVVAGDLPEGQTLGIMVDDSIAAFHGETAAARLAETKELLQETVRQLPRSSLVTVCTSTGEFPTPPMTPEEAVVFIGGLQPIPQPGNGVEASRNLKRELGGKRSCILVAAPRSEALWQELKDNTDFRVPTPIHFLDNSRRQTPVFIHSAEILNDRTVLQLYGDPDRLRQTVLELHAESGEIETHRVTTHEALHGRVPIALKDDQSTYCEVRVAESGNHPWGRYFLATAGDVSGVEQAVIFRRTDRESLVVDQIVSAVIQSFHADLRIRHLDPALATSVPQASILIIVGNAYPPLALQPWLTQQIDRGVRIMMIPVRNQARAAARGVLPGWQAVQQLPREELPIKVKATAMAGLDDLLLLGLGEIKPPDVAEPAFARPFESVITTRRDRLLLGRRQLSDHSTVWASGLPLTVDRAGSPAFHPAVPLLLDRVLFGRQVDSGDAVSATVGEAISLSAWFRQPVISGTLIQPDGSKLPVQTSARQPLLVPVNQAGIYSLSNAGTTIVRLANFPRERDVRLFPREQWDKRRPNSRTTWHDAAVDFALQDFAELEAETGEAPRRRLDLSPVALSLLFLFLLSELVLLLVVWRRKGTVSV